MTSRSSTSAAGTAPDDDGFALDVERYPGGGRQRLGVFDFHGEWLDWGNCVITSKDNERLKLVRKLHDRRWREKLGLFFVEGEDAIEAATAEPVDLLRAGEDVDAKLLADVASAPHPPRVIAVYRRADLPGWEERPATLALWRLADPGNVGTLIRTADAFGAAIVLSDGCADPTRRRRCARAQARSGASRSGAWDDAGGTRVALEAHGGRPLAELDLSGRDDLPARRRARRAAGRASSATSRPGSRSRAPSR